MRAAFLDWGSLNGSELDRGCLQRLPLEWHYFTNIPRAQLQAELGHFDIVISNKVVLDTALLQGAQRLRLICVAATGTNNVDLIAAANQGIVVTNVRAYATESVVQHTFMLMLNLLRRFLPYQQDLAAGRWSQSEYFCLLTHPVESLTGKTLGIIGYGELGQAVAKMAACFGMQVMVADSLHALRSHHTRTAPQRYPLEQILANADIISLHCPLSAQTHNLFNADTFARMKPSAILINTARGGIVNEADLVQALKLGKIAAAAVDVLAQEPPQAESILLQTRLDNLIVTPHIAWATRQARQQLLEKLAINIDAWLQGKPINQVPSA